MLMQYTDDTALKMSDKYSGSMPPGFPAKLPSTLYNPTS